MDAMRTSSFFAEALLAVFLIGLEVAFEPIPTTRLLIRSLPRKNVRSDAIEKHPVMADNNRATRKLKERRLQAGERLNIQIIGRLVKKQ